MNDEKEYGITSWDAPIDMPSEGEKLHPELEAAQGQSQQVDQAAPTQTPSQQEIEESYNLQGQNEEEHHQEEDQQEEQQHEAPSKPESAQQQNFKELRLAKEQAERETVRLTQEAERLAREREEYLQMLLKQGQSNKKEQEVAPKPSSRFADLDDDSFAEGRHLQAMHQDVSSVRTELDRLKSEYAQTLAQQKLASSCPDYDKVVNSDRISTFERLYPEEAQGILDIQDPTRRKIMAYNLIKKLGVYRDPVASAPPQARTHTSAPRPSASIKTSTSPLAKSSQYGVPDNNSEEAKRLLEEMYSSASRTKLY